MKYTKKIEQRLPEQVDAIKWTGDNLEELQKAFGKKQVYIKQDELKVKSHDTPNAAIFDAVIGEMIVKGKQGELYTCKEKIFERDYE